MIPHPAQALLEIMKERVKLFTRDLEDGELLRIEVGSAPGMAIVRAQNDGEAILFWGVDDQEREVMIVQHYTQLDFRLIAVKASEGEQPQRFGFLAAES